MELSISKSSYNYNNNNIYNYKFVLIIMPDVSIVCRNCGQEYSYFIEENEITEKVVKEIVKIIKEEKEKYVIDTPPIWSALHLLQKRIEESYLKGGGDSE